MVSCAVAVLVRCLLGSMVVDVVSPMNSFGGLDNS